MLGPSESSRYKISIVLPAFNEEANIERAMTSATLAAERLCGDHEILVVDDGSVDATAKLVEAASATDPRIKLLKHDGNKGYGEALRTGFTAAKMDLVFFTDSDNQFDLNELEAFLPFSDRVDVVAGFRVRRNDPWLRVLIGLSWNRLVRLAFYVPVRDIDCAFKLFRREVFDELDLESVGAMVNTELMVKIGRSGNSIVELGVSHYPRVGGSPRGAHPKVIFRAFYELVRMRGRLKDLGPGLALDHMLPTTEL